MSMNAVTLVSDCLLFIAEQKGTMSDNISTNNMVVFSTPDRIIMVLYLCAPDDWSWYEIFWLVQLKLQKQD